MNSESINPYLIAKSYAEDIMAEREYWSEDDLFDIACQHADGSQYVIYHYMAHQFVAALSGAEQSEAEDQVADCYGGEYLDYDRQASLIAYFALQSLILEHVQEMLEAEEAE